VAVVALLRVVPKKDVVSNRLRVLFPVSAAGFNHSGSYNNGLPPAHPPYGWLGSTGMIMAPKWARCIVHALLSPTFGLVGSE
jgi:hypothetical protein